MVFLWTLVLQHWLALGYGFMNTCAAAPETFWIFLFLFQFAEDYTIEADLPSNANKAAKFFETKKAEAKAATAIAKHEASKDGVVSVLYFD